MWAGMSYLEMHFNPRQHVLQLQSGLFPILLLQLLHGSTAITSRAYLSNHMQSFLQQQQGRFSFPVVSLVFAGVLSVICSQALRNIALRKKTLRPLPQVRTCLHLGMQITCETLD